MHNVSPTRISMLAPNRATVVGDEDLSRVIDFDCVAPFT